MSTTETIPLSDVDEAMLRALADAGYLPLAVYIEEMERRRSARAEKPKPRMPKPGTPKPG